MSFGCCGRFKECSDRGRCVYEGNREYEGCAYKEKIDMGFNFYTNYNENNKKRSEEYLSTKEFKHCGKVYVKTYIEIPNRLFLIGKRSPYGFWSRDLEKEESKSLIEILKSYLIICTNTFDKSKFRNETISEKEICDSRVILHVNDDEYNLYNCDCRAIKRKTAVKIASFLIKKGLEADIEIIRGFSGTKILKKIEEQRSFRHANVEKHDGMKNDFKQLSFLNNNDVYNLHRMA